MIPQKMILVKKKSEPPEKSFGTDIATAAASDSASALMLLKMPLIMNKFGIFRI